ncbi:phage head closure protein [Turicibacter sanguinis]|uniref:phage head closure protein n=1 Tax=Turicibacter sanguinis TaxID=154288 RepID=UPI0018AA4C47|nr:phage head closure protein [Turicibacter sanguinis]MDB8552160.1 phage head closure protein [Turicibacter sanguinis]
MLDQKILKKRLQRKFDQRITIKKRNVEIKAGREVVTWENYYSCLSNPTELYNAINIKFNSTAVFEVRYCKLIEAMRFKEKEFSLEFNGMMFNIYQVDYLKNDKFVATIKAKRVD